MSDQFYPSDLFDNHPETNQVACNEVASRITSRPVIPMKWQGANTYTVESHDPDLVVQFRSTNELFDAKISRLAKAVHGSLAPATEYRGLLPGSAVSIWTMEKLPGVGFLYMLADERISSKLETTVSDMARLVSSSRPNKNILVLTNMLQILRDVMEATSDSDRRTVEIECVAKLAQLHASLPDHLRVYVDKTMKALPAILQLPWVLTHADLSSSNILVDQNTGHLTGVVDWADAALWPFGTSLEGLENVLGYGNDDGWHWLRDDQSARQVFRNVFLAEVGELSSQQRACIEEARVLGLLLRCGFVWREGTMVPQGPTDDQYHTLKKLSIFIDQLDTVVGLNRLPGWQDEMSLPCLRGLIKEVHRWAPIGSLGVPHASIHADAYEGKTIPANTIVFSNLTALSRSRECYENPEIFAPERFLDDHLDASASALHPDYKKRDHFHYGFDRRLCQGIFIAEASLYIVVSRVLWGFDVSVKPGAAPLRMDDKISGLVTKPKAFEVSIVSRSSAHAAVMRKAQKGSVTDLLEFDSVELDLA